MRKLTMVLVGTLLLVLVGGCGEGLIDPGLNTDGVVIEVRADRFDWEFVDGSYYVVSGTVIPFTTTYETNENIFQLGNVERIDLQLFHPFFDHQSLTVTVKSNGVLVRTETVSGNGTLHLIVDF